MNMLGGVLLFVLSGICNGSHMVPMNHLILRPNHWKYEQAWLVFSVIAFFIVPWSFAFAFVSPRSFSDAIINEQPAFWALVVFGALWGVGGCAFGVAITKVGIGMGYGMIMALIAGVGTAAPLIISHSEKLKQVGGILTLVGLVFSTAGVVVCSYAYTLRERRAQSLRQTRSARQQRESRADANIPESQRGSPARDRTSSHSNVHNVPANPLNQRDEQKLSPAPEAEVAAMHQAAQETKPSSASSTGVNVYLVDVRADDEAEAGVPLNTAREYSQRKQQAANGSPPDAGSSDQSFAALSGAASTSTTMSSEAQSDSTPKKSKHADASSSFPERAPSGLWFGIMLCVVSGVFSAMLNVAFDLGSSLGDALQDRGIPKISASMALWTIGVGVGGVIPNIFYASYLLQVRHSLCTFDKAPNKWKDAGYCLLMALLWDGQVYAYGVGAVLLDDLGTVVGWPVCMSVTVIVANVWGFALHEWANAGRRAVMAMLGGLGLVALAVCTIVVGLALQES